MPSDIPPSPALFPFHGLGGGKPGTKEAPETYVLYVLKAPREKVGFGMWRGEAHERFVVVSESCVGGWSTP